MGIGNEQTSEVSLQICDGQGNVLKTIPASAASASGMGFCVYQFDPRSLPNPVWLRWTAPDGEEDLAGPCDPMKLHDLLTGLQLEAVDPLVEGPEETPDQDTSGDGSDDSDTQLTNFPWNWPGD